MENRKLDEAIKEDFRNILDYGEEEFDILEKNPKLYEIVTKAHPILVSKKMVATCVKTQNCGFNKVGDRYVFGAFGQWIKDETCDQPCLFAMSNFLPFLYMAYDRAASGIDLNDMHFEYVACMDTGCKFGGFGNAMYKMSFEDSSNLLRPIKK